MRTHLLLPAMAAILLSGQFCLAAPTVEQNGSTVTISGDAYRAKFTRESLDMDYEIKGSDGQWRSIVKSMLSLQFGYLNGPDTYASSSLRATWAMQPLGEAIVIGGRTPLDPTGTLALEVHCICAGEGMLVATRLTGTDDGAPRGSVWSPPRIALEPEKWDRYAFWGEDDALHAGALTDLQPFAAYAGVSPWGNQGDTTPRLSAKHPGLLVQSDALKAALGVVFVDYDDAWQGAHSFLQRHTASSLYLYSGYAPPSTDQLRWAWLAPFSQDDAGEDAVRVGELAGMGEKLVAQFQPIAPPIPENWTRPLPDIPAELARTEPVADINDAMIYTMGERTATDATLAAARKVGSDVIVRGWFKWAQAPPVQDWTAIPPKAHAMGALLGGGITCSALYDNENGLTREQVLDMATRGPAGQLIDAWETPGIRHGSLSSPAYIDYLFRWCQEQIDAGADYLFMDEHTAAIGGLEGYDDHSLADFRQYLLSACPQTEGWAPDDQRWGAELGIDLADKTICPSGKMDSFDYRAYMRDKGLIENPASPANSLIAHWNQFRTWRDDRAWRTLTGRIREHAKQQGRTVLISANGLAKYVDLQVLGVWGLWRTTDNRVDISDNQLPYWRSLVVRGRSLAERKVPVVLFHDWGFGDPPFPWLAASPSDRELWMRTRGAEIYAAGAFFAFPVLGPFGCDAGRDGTLPTIAQQAIFYKTHKDLYLNSRWLGSENLEPDRENLSLAAWWNSERSAVVLHVINRNIDEGGLARQENLSVTLPIADPPRAATVISPDFEGTQTATCVPAGGGIKVSLPALDAYSVVLLEYGAEPDLTRIADPVRADLAARWRRPPRSEFRVLPDGRVEHEEDLEGFLQGMLHTHMRNPPTFLVNAAGDAELRVRVRAVATQGARLQFRLDGEEALTVDLPDLDDKNDGNAGEYNKTISFAIPAGSHRVTLDNVGGDWVTLVWLEFKGKFVQ